MFYDFFVEKMRKAFAFFSTQNTGIFEILTFKIFSLMTLLVLNNRALIGNIRINVTQLLNSHTITDLINEHLKHIPLAFSRHMVVIAHAHIFTGYLV